MTNAEDWGPGPDRPVAMMLAPNGARLTAVDHPALPIGPEAVAATAVMAVAAGAGAVHLHVRDDEGAHSLDPGRYREMLAAVRASVGSDPVLQITTEAVGRFDRQTQMATVREVVPEAVSLAMKELVPDDDALADAAKFFAFVEEADIAAQIILYEPREVARCVDLAQRGIFGSRPPSALFVLGRYTVPGSLADPRDLVAFLQGWPHEWPWMICAFGRIETAALTAAAAMGGDVRVGFENSREHADGRIAKDNAERVRAMAAMLDGIGRPLATPKETRKRFGLRPA